MRADLTNSVVVTDDPLLPDSDAVEIFYRETPPDIPLVFVHSGWGYSLYPFDRQIIAFDRSIRILIPYRSGHGPSREMPRLPIDYHRRGAGEMLRFLDALEIDRSIVWGHSDGATIAAWMALEAPDRFAGAILESLHFYRYKPVTSAGLLAQLSEDPDQIGERVSRVLADEHGEENWREVITTNSSAWLRVAGSSPHPKADLFGGRLSELRVPTLMIHGSEDPRTEPDELDSVQQACPQARLHVIMGAGHSPHTEKASFEECNKVAGEFLDQIREGFDQEGPARR
jgi:pimeloyl-ACP methyl ester carboxylesterase